MELGISPVVTSSLIMQLLAGAKILDVSGKLMGSYNIPNQNFLTWSGLGYMKVIMKALVK